MSSHIYSLSSSRFLLDTSKVLIYFLVPCGLKSVVIVWMVKKVLWEGIILRVLGCTRCHNLDTIVMIVIWVVKIKRSFGSSLRDLLRLRFLAMETVAAKTFFLEFLNP